MALCQCGCGKETPIAKLSGNYSTKGEPRRFYPGHRADCSERYKAWCKQNREQLSAKRRNWRAQTKVEALQHYGGSPPCCACCGENHIEFLALDHINGDGGKIRKENPRMSGLYLALWLKQHDWPDGIRVLCANCNSARGSFGYCPHKIDAKDRILATRVTIQDTTPKSHRIAALLAERFPDKIAPMGAWRGMAKEFDVHPDWVYSVAARLGYRVPR